MAAQKEKTVPITNDQHHFDNQEKDMDESDEPNEEIETVVEVVKQKNKQYFN